MLREAKLKPIKKKGYLVATENRILGYTSTYSEAMQIKFDNLHFFDSFISIQSIDVSFFGDWHSGKRKAKMDNLRKRKKVETIKLKGKYIKKLDIVSFPKK